MKEIWKAIPKFSRYEASNLGRIRSMNYKNSNKIKVLKPVIAKDGYYQTMLLNDFGKYKSWKVHKFVAMTFLGEIGNKEVNHIDGNKLNNRIENLEIIPKSENILHAYNLGLITPKRGSSNGNSKLTEKQVKEIREIAKNGGRYYGRKQLAEKYGVSECCIKEIVNRRRNTWQDV